MASIKYWDEKSGEWRYAVGSSGSSIGGTVEIVSVEACPPGSNPTVTETADSLPTARKYILGIPAGATGTPGVGISDTSIVEDLASGKTTVTLDYSDGGTLSFVIPHGKEGRTPVKGEDYWTNADQQVMVAEVLAAMTAAEEVSF